MGSSEEQKFPKKNGKVQRLFTFSTLKLEVLLRVVHMEFVKQYINQLNCYSETEKIQKCIVYCSETS